MTRFPYIYKDSKQKKGKPVLNEQGSSSIQPIGVGSNSC